MKKKQDTYVRVDFQSVGVLITPMQKVYAVHVLIKKISLYVTYVMQKDIY